MIRHFFEYKPPRDLSEIESDIKSIEKEIVDSLAEITGSNLSLRTLSLILEET